MKYDGVDFFTENHHVFELYDSDINSGELLGKISPFVRCDQSFELSLVQINRVAFHMISLKGDVSLVVKVYHQGKVSYVVNILATVIDYHLGYWAFSASAQCMDRIIFRCKNIECND